MNPYKLSDHQLKVARLICENPDMVIRELALKHRIKYHAFKDALKAIYKKLGVNSKEAMIEKMIGKVPKKSADVRIAEQLQQAHDDLALCSQKLREECDRTTILTTTLRLRTDDLAILQTKVNRQKDDIEKMKDSFDVLSRKNATKKTYILKLETDQRSLRTREKHQDAEIAKLRESNELFELGQMDLEKQLESKPVNPTTCKFCQAALDKWDES